MAFQIFVERAKPMLEGLVRQFCELPEETDTFIKLSATKCLDEMPDRAGNNLLRDNGIDNPTITDWYNSTEHNIMDVKRQLHTTRPPTSVEGKKILDPGLTTQLQFSAFHDD
jgi:hypothetical protein